MVSLEKLALRSGFAECVVPRDPVDDEAEASVDRIAVFSGKRG